MRWQACINYGFYYLLLSWVYGWRPWIQLEILLLLMALLFIEWRLKPVWHLKEGVKKGLISFSQYLRVGYSPLRAYEKALEEIPSNHRQFKESLDRVLDQRSHFYEVIQGTRAYNHESLQRELAMILRRIRWQEEIWGIHRKNMWEVELMRYLPLVILGTITEVHALDPMVKGISLFMIFLAQGMSLFIIYQQ